MAPMILMMADPDLDDPTTTAVGRTHGMGTSAKLYEQFSQIGRSGRFQFFDYGSEENSERYGTEVPPEFPLNQITSPLALFQGIKTFKVNYLYS